jgi:hypothetical protein
MCKCLVWQQFVKKLRKDKEEKRGCMTYLYQGETRVDFIRYFKDCVKTPCNTGSISARVLRHPPSRAVFGFRAADITWPVIGNGDNNREGKDTLGARDKSCLLE